MRAWREAVVSPLWCRTIVVQGGGGTTEGTDDTENEGSMEHVQLVHEELTGLVRQTAFETHVYFGRGFLEKVSDEHVAQVLLRPAYSKDGTTEDAENTEGPRYKRFRCLR